MRTNSLQSPLPGGSARWENGRRHWFTLLPSVGVRKPKAILKLATIFASCVLHCAIQLCLRGGENATSQSMQKVGSSLLCLLLVCYCVMGVEQADRPSSRPRVLLFALSLNSPCPKLFTMLMPVWGCFSQWYNDCRQRLNSRCF